MAEVVARLRGLRKSYGGEEEPNEVLHGLDLTISAGEFIVVLGPSGSGKSTLLNLLGLMDRPSSGELYLFGQDAASLDEKRRARLRNRRVGFVFQFDSLLPEFTALENATLPARIGRKLGRSGLAKAEESALGLMDRLGVAALADRFPSQMSGGEKQRIAIARALVNEPALLLADEPTGNLDSRNGELVFNGLRELASALSVAVVVVTHNETAARHSSRVVRLADGRIETETEAR